jgi:hypothetical protein
MVQRSDVSFHETAIAYDETAIAYDVLHRRSAVAD